METVEVSGGVLGPARPEGGQGAGLMARPAAGSELALMAGSGARAEARMAKSEAEVHLRDPRDPREWPRQARRLQKFDFRHLPSIHLLNKHFKYHLLLWEDPWLNYACQQPT